MTCSPFQILLCTPLRWGSLVKFSHSIFALPFALSVAVLLARTQAITWIQIGWIVLACVSARTAAMAYNRLIDCEYDMRNSRTKNRELPRGVVSKSEVWGLVLLAILIFHLAAWGLGWHCVVLAPLVLAVVLGYSLCKRFTPYSHLVLGLALALAPGGVWYALTAKVSYEPVLLMAAVLCWVAGFDIVYACQDVEFDRAQGLHSIPARFGLARALTIARLLHLTCVVLLTGFGIAMRCGAVYFGGVIVFGALLLSQHRMVSACDLSQINGAFFSRNGTASVVFFVAVMLEVLVGRV